jgi:hypothetical protein
VDLGAKQEFNSVLIKEDGGFVRRFDVEILKDGKWVAVVSGKRIGDTYHAGFPTVKSQRVRLHILDAVCAPQYPGRLHGLNSHMAAFTGPAIWEFQVLLDPQPPPAIPLLVNPPVPPPPEIGLDTLEPISFKTGWQGPNATTWRNVNCHGQPLVVDGEKFQHGVGMHANAEAVFAVKPEYQRFVGRIGIDDAAAGRGSIIATVFLDDKQLYRSPVLSGGDGLWNLDVKLSGATEQSVLRLVIKDAGDGYDGDNADLVDAGFMVPGR